MISRALNALGLMKRSEHEAAKLRSAADGQLIRRLIDERDDWQGKFKLAATDLAKQAEEIERKSRALLAVGEVNAGLRESVETWKGVAKENARDAGMWRDSLKRSRDRKAARKGSVS